MRLCAIVETVTYSLCTVLMIQKPYVPFRLTSVVIGCYHFRVTQIEKKSKRISQNCVHCCTIIKKKIEHKFDVQLDKLNKCIGFYVSVCACRLFTPLHECVTLNEVPFCTVLTELSLNWHAEQKWGGVKSWDSPVAKPSAVSQCSSSTLT